MFDSHYRLLQGMSYEMRCFVEADWKYVNRLKFLQKFMASEVFGGFDPNVAKNEKDFVDGLARVIEQLDVYLNTKVTSRSNTRVTLSELRGRYGPTTPKGYVRDHLKALCVKYRPIKITRRSLEYGQTFRDIARN